MTVIAPPNLAVESDTQYDTSTMALYLFKYEAVVLVIIIRRLL